MASAGHNLDSMATATLICTELESESESEGNYGDFYEIEVSDAEINNWDLPSIGSHTVLKIKLDLNRGLLRGGFSESELGSISIRWNVESFLSVLRFVYGCQLDLTSDNFMSLYETALFFGVETLLLKCRVWLDGITSFTGPQPPQLCLDGLIDIWKHGLDHAHDFIRQQCTGYLARNFMWAQSCNSFSDVPDQLLSSCLKHPDLAVDSEKHLCDAILVWLTTDIANSKRSSNYVDCCLIRSSLLPLWFIAGKRRCHFISMFSDKATRIILSLARLPSTNLIDVFSEGDLSYLKIRLTKFTQKVDLSGCPQITLGLFLLSMLPSGSEDLILRKVIKKSPINYVNIGLDGSLISQELEQLLTFEAVNEVDISNCPSLPLESAADFFCQSFPSLKILRAAYFLNFKTTKLCHFVQKFPLLTSVDLTLDISPIIPTKLSIKSSSQILKPQRSVTLLAVCNYNSSAPLSYLSQSSSSNITKLTLEGRTDFSDYDLHTISEACKSLNYVNLRGCTTVTDYGLSMMIRKCKMLQSVLACGTSFGINSVQALCSGISSETQQSEKHSLLMAHKLQTLHIGGCNGANGVILSDLMSRAHCLRSLCLREIQLVDTALYEFRGSSLQMLDVSDTKVSSDTLCHVIFRNSDLKSLKISGCTRLLQVRSRTEYTSSRIPQELFSVVGKSCQLEEIGLGWGFSPLSLEALKPAIRTLRTITVGIGGSLGHDDLELLPTICPLLVTLILYFQNHRILFQAVGLV